MTSTPRTILHVVFSLEPGGMENGLVNVARRLDATAFQTHVCCLERAGEFLRRLPPAIGVTVLGKGAGFSPGTVLKLRGLLRRLQPAVVHTHNLGPLCYAALANAWGPAVPLLHGEHGMLTPVENHGWRFRLRRLLYRRCQAVHTVSHALLDYYRQRGFHARRMVAIPNGVDSERFAPGDRAAARQALGLPLDAVVAGMVGSFQRRKRHHEVLAAFNQLAGDFPHARLLLAGARHREGHEFRQFVAGSPAAGRIHLLDYQEDPRTCYHAMDFLVVASENEGLSNAALEAMACGIPVLAGEACGNAEIITPEVDGRLARLDDAAALGRELRRCFADAATLQVLGRNARQTVLNRFKLSDMAEGYARLYGELSGGGESLRP